MKNIIIHIRDRLKGTVPKGHKRSSEWRKVRRKYLDENPRCENCGSKSKLEIHHKIPFHLDPKLELDPGNLITLCDGGGKKGMKSCHRFFGHLGDWKLFNPFVEIDVDNWSRKIGVSKD